VIQPLRTSYLDEAGGFPWPVLIPASKDISSLSPSLLTEVEFHLNSNIRRSDKISSIKA